MSQQNHMTKIVRFHEIGGPEVLKIEDVPSRQASKGEACLRVQAIGTAAIPCDVGIRSFRDRYSYKTGGEEGRGQADCGGIGLLSPSSDKRAFTKSRSARSAQPSSRQRIRVSLADSLTARS